MNRRNRRSFITGVCVFVVTLALAGAELVVPAQNSNSSTTMQNDNMSAGNTNMGGTTRRSSGRRRRRGRRRGSTMGMPNTNAACGPMQENKNMAGSMQENANTAGEATGNANMGGRRRRGRRRGRNMNASESVANDAGSMNTAPVRTGRCDPNAQEQTDLSGTYTGTVNYSEGGLSGDATLTINGNDFTLTSGSSSQEGRVVAVTTCNYTAVTMMFGKWQPASPGGAQPAALPAISLRAKKSGSRVTLMTVPGEKREFSFTSSAGGRGSSKGRGRRRATKVGIKPPTVANNLQNAK